mmetsp:Transcript_18858/g.26371  ORF Transcript_18858/g.26371 Transcript_18858/m.26371 type:complete len:295 (-) Transcript_18858:1-885(-)
MDQQTSSERFDHVVKWLHKFYTADTVPSQLFEINESTIGLLYKLSLINDFKDQQYKVLRDIFSEVNIEYHSETLRLQRINQQLGLQNLSKVQSQSFDEDNLQEFHLSIVKSIQTLSELALGLDLKDTNMSSFFIGLSELLDNTSTLEIDLNSKKVENGKLLRTVQRALATMTNLRSLLDQLDSQKDTILAVTETKIANIKYFQSKSSEYQTQLAGLKQTLHESGFSPDIFHQTLVKLSQELQDIQKSIQPKLIQLKSYNDLPPDTTLALVKLEEARHQLSVLEDQLNFSINQFL